MPNADEIIQLVNKTYKSDSLVEVGVSPITADRAATGIFPFDYASGGGFPRGRISILWGPASSLKTSLSLKAIAVSQKTHPHKKCVFVDVESSYDTEWAEMLGVDNSKLIYVRPDFAEQAIDIIEAFLGADDVDLVVVDSLAALITTHEVESSAEKAMVGGAALAVGKLYRKAVLALSKSRKRGDPTTLIAINQVRQKIGVMYGSNELMPGGQSMPFGSSLTIRVSGKDILDKKIDPDLPAYKQCTGIIQKKKVQTFARNFEFALVTAKNNELQLNPGECYDWPLILACLKDFGLLKKDGKNWVVGGEEYATQDLIKARYLTDIDYKLQLQSAIMESSSTRSGGKITDGNEVEENAD